MSGRVDLDAAALEALLEPIERRMYLDLYDALPASVARKCGISRAEDGGALQLTCETRNHPFFNRVMGVGARAEKLAAWLDRIEEHYAGRGITRWMLQVAPAGLSPGLTDALSERGLVPLRGWVKHAGRVDDLRASIATRPGNLRVERIGSEGGEAFASILVPAFDFPGGSGSWPAATVGRPGWLHYLAYDGEMPAACGAMFVMAGVATLTFAATRPECRQRGAQTALIARRIRDARDLGLDWIVTETDEELPHRPNPSYRNVERAGMPARYLRSNWGPPPPSDTG